MALVAAAAFILTTSASCGTAEPFIADSHSDWEQREPPPADELVYRVFLLGDVGNFAYAMDRPAMRLLRDELQTAGSDAAVVFLGDNLYCCGLPDSSAANYAEESRRLVELLQVVEDFEGRVVFVPGNHDWNHGREGGMEAVRRQEQFIESYLDRGNVFLPDDAFPGPAAVRLTDDLTLVALDTQWWLHGHERPTGDTGEYDLEEETDFLLELDDVLRRHRRSIVVVAGHHPVYSNGRHGGFSRPREHLFPLTAFFDRAYVPLPVVGSIFVTAKHFVGGVQDFGGRRYASLRSSLERSFLSHERLVYAAGHDHTLQHFDLGEQQYVVSATAGSSEYVAPRGRAAFTSTAPGLVSLQLYRDGSLWMEAWEAVDDGSQRRLLYRYPLFEAVDVPPPDLVASTAEPSRRRVAVAANPSYRAGPLKEVVFGSQNRDAWTTPVEAPVLDLGAEAGGLTPLRRGGGFQTSSLRLQGADGRLYALRSVDKDPLRSLPPSLRETVARDLLQDAISSLHPYGALVIPPLADAVGVLHTHPRLFFVPDDPRLGHYREEFANRLMLLERRPDGTEPDLVPGCEADVVGAATLYRRLNGDNDHHIDQRRFARARLLDMLLSDWDRHRGQWRWAACPDDEEGWIYHPVAMDRDWAFNQMNGLLPSLVPYVRPKFQDFDRKYGNLAGLTTNGLEQDRRFLNELSRDDWRDISEQAAAALSDEVIVEAVSRLPRSIASLDSAQFVERLRIRRERLPEIADRFYELHARVVDVVGSDKHERFEVHRLPSDETMIVVTKITREGVERKEIYRRTFKRSETKEIRLFGLDGEDEFLFYGDAPSSIVVRAIGGGGHDHFAERGGTGGSAEAHWYDTGAGDEFEEGAQARLRIAADPRVNEYDPAEFRYDLRLPLVHFGVNRDEGAMVGGGVTLIRHGFRKDPYARLQRFSGRVGTNLGGFQLFYGGHFVDVAGEADVRLDAELLAPNSFRNFYGLGNETTRGDGDASYYRARLRQLIVEPALEHRLRGRLRVITGAAVQYSRVDRDEGRFVAEPQPGVTQEVFRDQWLSGLTVEAVVDDRDDRAAPQRGARWRSRAEFWTGLRNADARFGHLASDLSLFLTPAVRPPATFALRFGGAHNIGTFPFYRANVLGGSTNLRGFRSTRFAGRTSVYQNAEIRIKLTDVSTYVARGDLGLHVFLDSGRVWTDGERSRVWHHGYGVGLWMRLFEQFVVTGTYDASVEERGFTLRAGFLY